jgi:hypothetical protein
MDSKSSAVVLKNLKHIIPQQSRHYAVKQQVFNYLVYLQISYSKGLALPLALRLSLVIILF